MQIDFASSAARRLLASTLVLSSLACVGGPSNPDTSELMDRDTFIATYVDLRVAALTSEEGEVTDGSRPAVLTRHGVTEEDLVFFAEVHGGELTFMRDLWNEVELQLEERRTGSREEGR